MDLHASIVALWDEARPRLAQRLTVLDGAQQALLAGRLEPGERAAAVREAHTLAGTLGTFGKREAAAAARALEHDLASPDALATLRRVLRPGGP